jgi:hypothetical protein
LTAPPPPPSDHGAGHFFGILLMAAGALICALSGVCSLGVLGMMMASPGQGPGAASAIGIGLVVVAIFGGVPFVMGLASIFIGRHLYRSSRPPPDLDKTFR